MTSFSNSYVDLTPGMEAAQRELEARIDHALLSAHDLRGALEDLERDEKDEPITDEDVERFRLYITGHARTDAWQPVFERLERGELTWRKIVEDFASGNLDRETARALTSLRDVPPATPEQLNEIGFDRFAPEKAEAEPEEPEPEPEQPADAGGGFGGRFFNDDDDW
ncbi:hypothetical protein [Thermocrispum municipale]|uniref:hypothetical protein n=1 Tax=Thermocrispum municipale TaxID=37926 RepID=UPI0004296EAC|nr:hypothetical protein [Thermocrispum municipale]